MSKFYGNTIQKGSTHTDDIKEWQTFLKGKGYYTGSIDGDFGTNTDAATRAYQRDNGLDVDGIVGVNTWGHAGYKSYNTPIEAPESTPFEYDPYTKSQSVIDAEEKASDADDAYNNYGDFSKYYDRKSLDDVMLAIQNRKPFSYDLNGDALYQQYKDKYIQQGKMAMQDTMGQAAAMTGGYGNSYASTAGNQAYQASLENLNDIVPELWQMAYDRYNQEGQDLYNQYAMLSDDMQTQYGMYSDKLNQLASDRSYYQGVADSEFNKDYGMYNDNLNLAYNTHRDSIEDAQWVAEFNEGLRQYEQSMALTREQWDWQKSQAASSGSSGGGGGGSGSGGGTDSDILWYATGTYDDSGNPIFRNSEGKTQAFGQGINPYTGTKHSDAKYGTFSNGYQPNNIGGTKLKNSGMTTSITGKSQTIWEANGKYWLWRGDLNKYEEVDISD